VLSYSSKWVGESGLNAHMDYVYHCTYCCHATILVDKLILAQLDTNCPFPFMKLEGSLQTRCPHNGGCILLQNISKFLADYTVSHPNVSNLHSHCHVNLKSVSYHVYNCPCSYCKSLQKTSFVKLLGSKSQDGVPDIVYNYS